MLISATIIVTPRRSYHCEVCGEWIHASHIRLYGSGQEGDAPYVIRIHPECAMPDVYAKLRAAAQHCVKPNADRASILYRVEQAVSIFGGVGLR